MRAGYVETHELGPAIGELIHKRGYTIVSFADAMDCDESHIRKLVAADYPRVKFDWVDRILCKLYAWDLWYSEFAHLYPTKFRETCALPSCGKTFPEKQKGSIKRYCSTRCRKLANDVQRGKGTGNRYRQKNRCLKGHPLTPENTMVFPRGARACKTCRRERQRIQYRERYQNDPAFRDRERERARQRQAA